MSTRNAIGTICLLILSGILVAGLWPFCAPRNDVTWLSDGNGLFFGIHGSIVSASILEASRSQSDGSCSLEIWLAPKRLDSPGTILSFYRPESRAVPFTLRQWRGGLELGRESHVHFAKKVEVYVGDVFSSLKPVFITITSGAAGTRTYVDGRLVKTSPNFTISNQDLTGELVVGGAPLTSFNWSGQLKGLAVYDHELSAAEVSRGFEERTKDSQPDFAKSESVVARYLFDEGKGNIVRNRVGSATDLLIPGRFFVLNQWFLERPWDEYRPGWHYWKDIVVNIVGFIPLGFFFRAYFSTVRRIKRATGLTIALGLAVSLTIEVLQAFLPTRDSGMTDLLTNTFGTALGSMLGVWSLKRSWLAVVISSGGGRF